MYTVLDRLEDRQLITKRRSRIDARRWVYCLPLYTTEEGNTTEKDNSTLSDTPPPSHFSSEVELIPESIAVVEEEVSQHLFNTNSTVIQQPPNVDFKENNSTVDEAKNIEIQEFIQHTTREEGERGCVEQAQSEDVLQITGSEENQAQVDQTQQLTQGWFKQVPLSVGERLVDLLTGCQGVVVAVEDDKIIFQTRDWGRMWRYRELVVKLQ